MARIRAGEAEAPASLSERLFASMPWLFELLQALETKPVFAGGFASALCVLLLFGAVMAQRPEVRVPSIPATGHTGVLRLLASATPATLAQPVNQMLIADNSTNPVVSFALRCRSDKCPLAPSSQPSRYHQAIRFSSVKLGLPHFPCAEVSRLLT